MKPSKRTKAEATAIATAVSEVETSLNNALLVVGDLDTPLRKVLLTARGDIREAIGEART